MHKTYCLQYLKEEINNPLSLISSTHTNLSNFKIQTVWKAPVDPHCTKAQAEVTFALQQQMPICTL